MKKIISALVIGGALAACGSPKDDPSSSSSTSNPGSSSQPNTSSSQGQSSSTSSEPLTGSAAAGQELFNSNCTACHSDDGSGFFTGVAAFDVNRFTYHTLSKYESGGYTGSSIQDLSQFINEQMAPKTSCGDDCGDDIASYLWSLRGQTKVVEQVACDASAPVLYGKRALKILTSYEYHNSLQALFNQPLPDDFSTQNRANSDYTIARMPNHIKEPLGEGRLNAYDGNANELAEWAIATDGALSFDCLDSTTCANSFINEFAYYAFRRPLTSEERAEYREIISGPSDVQTGLKWAIHAALSSPQFLYRSELGTKVSDARNAVPEQPTENDVVQGEPVTAIAMENVDYDTNDMGEYGAYQYVGVSSPYNWTGDDIVVIRVQANGAGAGRFGIKVDNGAFEYEAEVTSSTPQVLTFRVEGITGSGGYIQTYNQSGNPITVSKLIVGPAVLPETPAEDIPKLDVADSDAYVLDAFEYASALSYMYTGSSPDRELMRAAFAGELSDIDNVESQIDRMLDSDAGREHVGRLAGLWFRTDGVVGVNRNGNDNFTQEVKDSMAQEIREIFKHVFYNESEPFTSIYTGDFTMLDSTLSAFYGIPGGGNGHMNFSKVDTSGSPRGGVIASGAFMASNAAMDRTAPIIRAVHVRQDVLCQAIPLPTNLEDSEARAAAGELADVMREEGELSTADFFDIQTTVEGTSCATCHNAIINPLFAIDDFDNVGMPRERVNGLVVQTGHGDTGKPGVPIHQVNDGGYLYSGDVVGLLGSAEADRAKEDGNGIPFSGAKGLGRAIVEANLPGIEACLIEKTARLGLGHSLNPEFTEENFEDPLTRDQKSHMACVNQQMESAYRNNNQSARAAMKALGLSDAIRFRR